MLVHHQLDITQYRHSCKLFLIIFYVYLLLTIIIIIILILIIIIINNSYFVCLKMYIVLYF